jgi:CRISPR system Cascade subunit CasA
MTSLLDDRVISTQADQFTLPGVLAALARGEVRRWSVLRSHQRPAWHMFLVQLAALALTGRSMDAQPEAEIAWRDLLLELTGGDPQPWALTGPDDKSAFLQPPVPPGLAWSPVATADGIDMLITARNHDLKQQVAREAEPEDWIFALVSTQTMEGYGGRGNFGIARMNGGSSSRPLLGLAPAGPDGSGPDPSSWWRRDLARLLTLRREGLEHAPGRPGGPALLWTLDWAEGQQLALADLDPWCIEVCRRIRLTEVGGRLSARRATSAEARIAAKVFRGVTGDPWTPVTAEAEPKSLTLGEGDFTYEKLCDLMFSAKWLPPPLALPGPDEGESLLVAEALSRGNSKTDGFRTRVVPVPGRALRFFGNPRAGEVAKAQMAEIKVFDEALRNALALMTAGGEIEKIGKKHYARSNPTRARFDRRADALFFPALWARLDAEDIAGRETAMVAFLRDLLKAARAELEEALPSLPCPATLRPRALTRARRVFYRRVAVGHRDGRDFQFLFEKEMANAIS